MSYVLGVKLYDKSKTGKIREWSVTTEGAEVVVTYGEQGGQLTESRTTSMCKNKGKSNQTTAEEQAVLEAISKFNKQVKKGYVQDISEIGKKTLPPLAKKYQDASSSIKWPCYTSVKLDGVRMTAFYKDGVTTFQSRGGDPYPVIGDIAVELYDTFWKTNPDLVIDGELYKHGMFLEDIVSAVKKHNDNTSKIQFHVFDVYNPNEPKQPLNKRYRTYSNKLYKNIPMFNRVLQVEQHYCETEEEMIQDHDLYVTGGYEGMVIRNRDSLFEFNKRTSNFQKYKVQMDEEFRVVDFIQGKNGSVSAICEVHLDDCIKEFKAPLADRNIDKQKELYNNKSNFIGKYITVKFEKYSKYGVPTKPKGYAFRDVDDNGRVLT